MGAILEREAETTEFDWNAHGMDDFALPCEMHKPSLNGVHLPECGNNATLVVIFHNHPEDTTLSCETCYETFIREGQRVKPARCAKCGYQSWDLNKIVWKNPL